MKIIKAINNIKKYIKYKIKYGRRSKTIKGSSKTYGYGLSHGRWCMQYCIGCYF